MGDGGGREGEGEGTAKGGTDGEGRDGGGRVGDGGGGGGNMGGYGGGNLEGRRHWISETACELRHQFVFALEAASHCVKVYVLSVYL